MDSLSGKRQINSGLNIMNKLLIKYSDKLVSSSLAEKGAPLLAGLDAELVWNRNAPEQEELKKLFEQLNINSLLFCEPKEPYKSIIDFLAENSEGKITPSDCETRTFLHDLPVIENFNATDIAEALSVRKSVIIPGKGIVTYGTVSPEQAFVFYSSVCFACFVKFYSDFLYLSKRNKLTDSYKKVFDKITPLIKPVENTPPKLMEGPFEREEDAYAAISQAGRKTVEYKLVDSYFGNVSYLLGNTLYISQTGSSLDELEGCIDPCPLDKSSCAAITASSEYSAHRQVVVSTDYKAILHGHPAFSVIMSMDCEKDSCHNIGKCHLLCEEKRSLGDIPIVPGEVGTGKYGLCNTLPPAIQNARGVIVYGHGLFAKGRNDFTDAFATLVDVERFAYKKYFKNI